MRKKLCKAFAGAVSFAFALGLASVMPALALENEPTVDNTKATVNYTVPQGITLQDGTYSLDVQSSYQSIKIMSDDYAPYLVVDGDTSYLVVNITTTPDAAGAVRFDAMWIGKRSEAPDDASTADVINGIAIYDEDDPGSFTYNDGTGIPIGYTYVIAMTTSEMISILSADSSDVYFVMRYTSHYQSSSGTSDYTGKWAGSTDHYMTLGEPVWQSDSTDVPGVEESEPIELSVTNNTSMFKVTKATLTQGSISDTLTVTLSGSGYHYLYKGTYEQAVANGSNTDNWIAGVQDDEGHWYFEVPITSEENYIALVSISDKYYEAYLKGEGDLESAFYPRQFELNREQLTLVTGDYDVTIDLSVKTRGLSPTITDATLETYAGPNSTSYAETLTFALGSDYDAAFIGSASDAAGAEASDIIEAEDGVITLSMKGCIDKETAVAFRSSEGIWIDTTLTLSKDSATLSVMGEVERFSFSLEANVYVEGDLAHKADFTDVSISLIDEDNTQYTGSMEDSAMVFSNLPADTTYELNVSRDGYTLVEQGDYNEETGAYDYRFTGDDVFNKTITGDDNNETFSVIFMAIPEERTELLEALSKIPSDFSLFTDETAEALAEAVAASDSTCTNSEDLAAMVEALENALSALKLQDGTYVVTCTGMGGMFKIIDATLIVEDGVMTLDPAVSGTQTYTKIYMGTLDEALVAAEDDPNIIEHGDATTNSNDKAAYEFVIPVSALNTVIPIAAYSSSKETWNSTGNFIIYPCNISKISSKDWIRLSGSSRYDTAQAIAKTGFEKSSYAIVASGANFPDALAAAALGGAYDCPVVLTSKKKLSDQAKSTLQDLGVENVIIVGGTSAVSDKVADSIRALINKAPVRVAGSARTETSIKIMNRITATGATVDTVIIASGQKFPDALSVGPYAFTTTSPILLTGSNKLLTDQEIEAIKAVEGIKNIIIVGGKGAVGEGVIKQLGDSYTYTRLSGENRYETSYEISNFELEQGMSVENVAVATGKNYPDALSGAALCGHLNSALILVKDKNSSGIEILTNKKRYISQGYVLGGKAAVSDSLMQYIESVTKF